MDPSPQGLDDNEDDQPPRRPTMHDVAHRAGVALSSVSRALGDHPDVSQAMRRRVKRAAQELGYEPNFLAQSLRTGTTQAIGFMARDIVNPFFAAIATGAEQRLRQSGYAMMIMNSDGDPEVEAEHVTMLRKRRVDGLILNVVAEDHQPTLDSVAALNCPVVLIDRTIDRLTAAAVLCDHYHGVRAATEDLLRLGHTEIALITGAPSVYPTRERARGMVEALEAAGGQHRPQHLVLGGFTSTYAKAQTIALLESPHPPTAILAGGVQVTIGVLEALVERGLTPGTDVAVVALDEADIFAVVRPTLSVVTRDPRRLGIEAATLLLDLIAGGAARTVTLPTEYRPGGTTMPVPVAHGSGASPT